MPDKKNSSEFSAQKRREYRFASLCVALMRQIREVADPVIRCLAYDLIWASWEQGRSYRVEPEDERRMMHALGCTPQRWRWCRARLSEVFDLSGGSWDHPALRSAWAHADARAAKRARGPDPQLDPRQGDFFRSKINDPTRHKDNRIRRKREGDSFANSESRSHARDSQKSAPAVDPPELREPNPPPEPMAAREVEEAWAGIRAMVAEEEAPPIAALAADHPPEPSPRLPGGARVPTSKPIEKNNKPRPPASWYNKTHVSDWSPNQEIIMDIAREKGIHDRDAAETTFQQFIDYHTARGTRNEDWFAAWRFWLARAVEIRDAGGHRGADRGRPRMGIIESIRAARAFREAARLRGGGWGI